MTATLLKKALTRCPCCKAKMERVLGSEPLPPGWTCGRCETGIPLRGRNNQSESLLSCVVCNSRFFYAEKDFPRTLSFSIIGIGIVLSVYTYGLSLMICGAIDFWLYKVLPMMRICYACKTEYRGYPLDKTIEAFDPHKGVAYDARQAIPKI